MTSTNTMIRFKMQSDKSDHGPIYSLHAELEEDLNCEWSCHLNVKHAQSRTELSIEVSRSKVNKTSSAGRFPLFFYDIYQSRLQPARRNETQNNLRVDLLLLSRTALPFAAFHSLGRVNVAQDGVAAWLTKAVSEHLQKILKNGFDEPIQQKHPRSLKAVDLPDASTLQFKAASRTQ